MITLVRCDDRLIHGQCVTTIIPKNGIKRVVAIDEYTATNPMMKKIFLAAAPKGVRVYVATLEEAVPMMEKSLVDDVPTLVLMRFPELYEKVLEKVPNMPKEYNIANVPPADGRVQLANACYLSQEQIESLKRMSAAGVHIYFNLIPSQPTTEWDSIKSKY